MAHSIFLSRPSMQSPYCPSSPDPTHLRLLAFSVAEAALQPDPNSPSFNLIAGQMPTPPEMFADSASSWPTEYQREAAWAEVGPWSQKREKIVTPPRARPLWDVVEHAKERRVKDKSSPSPSVASLPQSPPLSPSYNFVLPPNSPLAASIAGSRSPVKSERPSLASIQARRFPLFTRSVEPSPTNSTFSTLDQSRPPPEFVPRLSASEFSAKAKQASVAVKKHSRTKSDVGSPAMSAGESPAAERPRSQANPSRHTMRLPSLAQIQAKMSKPHRRGASAGAVSPRQEQTRPRINTVYRTDSQESVEVIKTPTDESPRRDPRIVLASILNRRPSTPPSPTVVAKEKEPRLAPFLRERTSGRLSGTRPKSMPPLSLGEVPSFEAIVRANARIQPAFKVTSPKDRVAFISETGSVPSPTKGSFPWSNGMCTPTEGRFNLSVAVTPPPRSTTPSRRNFTSPASPTDSIRSMTTASPTLSIPMITCTPAPQTVVGRDGLEQESDEEEGEVVLFEGETEQEEREKRAEAMKARLMLRRKSD
ncbi:hypothetical protein CI109_103031 [Kwoniella shandongensis]|uniref:Uncharacterized protein n=1 Tax=Kwoniella shandongensis TaxID=1734106 RepID=A0A5M6C893_9TREE|nr:uncharacterized protein CI109_000219 [Kwoniella shandongensis]KAA5531378.1 hypothetical protein CI109_000219 [Kwoniella shandongensis]